MRIISKTYRLGGLLLLAVLLVQHSRATEPAAAVGAVIPRLMSQWDIPGMAVGVTLGGHDQVFTFGVRSRATGRPVSPDTLFELGSVSKTLTATLVLYARERGALSLDDRVDRFLLELAGTPFGAVQLVHLATHTPGGLPLQVPDAVDSLPQLMNVLRAWRPQAPPGTLRTYSNISVGVLGLAAARSLGRDFAPLMEGVILPGLGLGRTYLHVPAGREADYAQGYTQDGAPVRMRPGTLWEEAYGMRSTAGDLLRFLDEHMGSLPVTDPVLARAVVATRTGYAQAGPMTQAVMWEEYPLPVSLASLLEGNSTRMAYAPVPAATLAAPVAPGENTWVNKTGSTAGFAAYVAFMPRRRVGIVLLANRSYPLADRVRAAFDILSRLPEAGAVGGSLGGD
jgi:beta-lactamase class C